MSNQEDKPINPTFKKLFFLCFFVLYYTSLRAESTDNILVGNFSRMSITDMTPAGWRPLVFDSIESRTAYYLTRLDNNTVVQAVSHASASAYYKKLNISSSAYPIIKWQWQIEHILEKGNVMSKEGDDYPARIYISFAYDPERLGTFERLKYKLYSLTHDEPPPLAVINYIWDNNAPLGTIVSNAYSNRVKMIVVKSGNTHAGQWQLEQRNIFEDYKKAFGEEPGHITGIAIMTDTDNTGESATAWYGDITFSKK